MSYDLFFTKSPPPSTADLMGWFGRRSHYQMSKEQAFYEHPETGVYWSFDFSAEDGERVPVAFNLNYFRPDVFALEAAREVEALVEAFGLGVDDPQVDGMGRGAFTVEGFLAGWRAGNKFAHDAILSQHPDYQVLYQPAAVNRGVAAWNRAREAYIDWMGTMEMTGGFAPTAMFLRPEDAPDQVLTAAVWTEAMACALPELDVIILMAEGDEAPRVVELDALRNLLLPYERRPATHTIRVGGEDQICGLAHWMVDHPEPPRELVEALKTLGAPRRFERVGPDTVLDAELRDSS